MRSARNRSRLLENALSAVSCSVIAALASTWRNDFRASRSALVAGFGCSKLPGVLVIYSPVSGVACGAFPFSTIQPPSKVPVPNFWDRPAHERLLPKKRRESCQAVRQRGRIRALMCKAGRGRALLFSSRPISFIRFGAGRRGIHVEGGHPPRPAQ